VVENDRESLLKPVTTASLGFGAPTGELGSRL
jgi:hypothetical protein